VCCAFARIERQRHLVDDPKRVENTGFTAVDTGGPETPFALA
jgi:hypothetical protein